MIKYYLFIFLISFCVVSVSGQGIDKEKITEYFQNQQFEDAIGYLQPFYVNDTADLKVLNYLGYAYYMNEEWEKALACFKKILLSDSTNVSANQWLANVYIGRNQSDSAKVYILRLIQTSPGHASYYRMLGDIYHANRQKDSALFFYRYAYRLAPDNNKNIVAYVDCLIGDSNYFRADSILHVSLNKDSSNTSYLKFLIQSSYAAKNYPGILSPGEKLIALGDLSVKVLPKLVFAYFTLNKYQDCIRVCELLDSNSLAGESIYYYEAKSWAALDSLKRSNDLLEKCLGYSISKTSELYYYTLARNYEKLKQFDRAKTGYDTAFYLFRNPLILYYCGQMFDNADQPKKAKIYYLRFLWISHGDSGEEKTLTRYARSRCKEIK